MTLVVSVSIHVQEQQEHQILQSDLNERERWPYTWSMQILSTYKSSHYHFLNNHILQQVDCSPYPGVTLTHDLRWTTRINITRKASSTLGILRRNLPFCPPSCRKTAYISLVHSVLEYSAEMCSSLHQPKLQRPLPWTCHQHAERTRTAVASSAKITVAGPAARSSF